MFLSEVKEDMNEKEGGKQGLNRETFEGLYPRGGMEQSEEFEPVVPAEEEGKPEFNPLNYLEEQEKERFVSFLEAGGGYKQKKEALDLIDRARQKASELEKEGFEKGYAQGQKQGFESGEKKSMEILQNLENLLGEIRGIKEEILNRYERQILELVAAIAGKIVDCKISLDDTAVREAVVKALHLAADKSRVVLKVNPEDFNYIENVKEDFFNNFNGMKSITVTADTAIGRGGCILETPCGDVDARIDTQMEKLWHSLEEAFSERR